MKHRVQKTGQPPTRGKKNKTIQETLHIAPENNNSSLNGISFRHFRRVARVPASFAAFALALALALLPSLLPSSQKVWRWLLLTTLDGLRWALDGDDQKFQRRPTTTVLYLPREVASDLN